MSVLRRREGVDDDVFEQAVYLAQRSPMTATRFVDAVETTLKELAKTPGIGSPKHFKNSALAAVRTWRVDGFPNHLIYYIPIAGGVDVLAILHGAQLPRAKLKRRSNR
jgi:plasmid stabilization system protein ParE